MKFSNQIGTALLALAVCSFADIAQAQMSTDLIAQSPKISEEKIGGGQCGRKVRKNIALTEAEGRKIKNIQVRFASLYVDLYRRSTPDYKNRNSIDDIKSYTVTAIMNSYDSLTPENKAALPEVGALPVPLAAYFRITIRTAWVDHMRQSNTYGRRDYNRMIVMGNLVADFAAKHHRDPSREELELLVKDYLATGMTDKQLATSQAKRERQFQKFMARLDQPLNRTLHLDAPIPGDENGNLPQVSDEDDFQADRPGLVSAIESNELKALALQKYEALVNLSLQQFRMSKLDRESGASYASRRLHAVIMYGLLLGARSNLLGEILSITQSRISQIVLELSMNRNELYRVFERDRLRLLRQYVRDDRYRGNNPDEEDILAALPPDMRAHVYERAIAAN